jgi:hypothetical protein
MRSRCASLVGVFTFAGASAVGADDVGCTIVLCLSNPSGYAAVGECIKPVLDFVQSVGAGGAAPTCDGGSAQMAIGRGKKANQRTIDWTDSAGVRQRMNY